MIKSNMKRVCVTVSKKAVETFLKVHKRSLTALVENAISFSNESDDFYKWIMFDDVKSRFVPNYHSEIVQELARKGRAYMETEQGKKAARKGRAYMETEQGKKAARKGREFLFD